MKFADWGRKAAACEFRDGRTDAAKSIKTDIFGCSVGLTLLSVFVTLENPPCCA